MELEKKLQIIPKLELKNKILLEEKQILIKQLIKPTPPPPPPPPPTPPPKFYRTVGCNSVEVAKKTVGIECKKITREVGCWNKFEEPPKKELLKMQDIIKTLKEKLNEQTLIIKQKQQKPRTRSVAIMHKVIN